MGQSHGLAGVDLAPMKGDGRRLGNLEVQNLIRSDQSCIIIAHRSTMLGILSDKIYLNENNWWSSSSPKTQMKLSIPMTVLSFPTELLTISINPSFRFLVRLSSYHLFLPCLCLPFIVYHKSLTYPPTHCFCTVINHTSGTGSQLGIRAAYDRRGEVTGRQ